MDALRVARVHWTDASHHPGWYRNEAYENLLREDLAVIETVGWLVYECEAFVVLAQSVGETSAADFTKIPRSLIVEMWIQHETPEAPDSQPG